MRKIASRGREKQMKVAITFASVLTLAATNLADELPRNAKTPRESYPNVDVIYDSITTPHGERLRTIITKPHDAKGKLPVIFVAGWLSCDSVEAPTGTKDATGLAFRVLAQLPGFCMFRVDKQGVGDSEGDCAENDFESELAGYRTAFHALKNYDFIDTNRVYVLGISNGGGFAPLIPETDTEQAQVRGYVVVGGWVKTWFEHMLEIERRRFALMGKPPGEVNDRMKNAATLYHDWLIKNKTVDQILQENSELAELWPEEKDHAHLYGRPLAFYQQLQKLNLAAVWARVKVPTLVLHGQFDWIMSREDHELIAQYVNANRPGAARFIEVPQMGHTFQHYLSFADAFHGKEAQFDPKVVQLVIDWLKQQAKNNVTISPQSSSAPTGKHPLDLGDFSNRTDEKIFNGTLKQALRTALDESPFFDLATDGLLAQSSDKSRERSADEVFVAASIEKRGAHFVVGLKATNGAAGETLAEEHVEAADQRNVLNALGQAAQRLRIQLGEPADSVQQFSTPLERATSASLEALLAWSFGVEAKQSKGPRRNSILSL
jgi:pimeloyl-ACP methyl ester carboxylesterase